MSPDKSFHIFNPSVQLTNATRDHLDKLPSGMASLSFREFAKRIQVRHPVPLLMLASTTIKVPGGPLIRVQRSPLGPICTPLIPPPF